MSSLKAKLLMAAIKANTPLMVVIAILLPPVAVFLKTGVGLFLVLSIVLWLLGVIPGIAFALWCVLKK